MGPAPLTVRVVVPCRDEAASLRPHLRAMSAAVARCARDLPHVAVGVVVVLDDCRDGSADVLRRYRRGRPWLHALEVRRGRVGQVRADGVALARRLDTTPASRTWLAHTDADSQVPPHWLVHHAGAALRGLDLWLGTVRPAASAPVVAAWAAEHHLGADHRHVHGANLGVRLSAYDAVGGFAPVATGEDVGLADALLRQGARVGADDHAPVLTSARLLGRTPKGFATFLAARGLATDPVGG